MQGVAESSKGHHKSAKVKLQDPGAGSGITVIHEEYRSEPASVSYEIMLGDSARLCPWCHFLECMCTPFKKVYVQDSICHRNYCISYGQVFWLVTTLIALASLWVYIFELQKMTDLPASHAVGLFMLCVSTYFVGWILAYIGFPTSIGMFAVGILFVNVGWFSHDSTNRSLIMNIRATTLGFILIRGGLLLGPPVSKKDSITIVKMALIPGLSEFAIAALVSWLLTDIKWDWALLLGSTVAPMSPLAILHSVTKLKEQGYGEDTNIFTMLLHIHTFDNIMLITIFGMAFTTVSKVHTSAVTSLLLEIFVTIIVAIVAGFLIGVILTYFPHRYDPYCGVWRTFMLFAFGFGAILISHTLQYGGAGYLCATMVALTASIGWRTIGVMGTELDFKKLTWEYTINALIIFSCCVVVRSVLTYLVSTNSQYNKKERLFMALVCLCKGSSQAALGPTAWMAARDDDETGYAQIILRSCICSIVLTISIAPFYTLYLGKKLLSKVSYDLHLSRPVELPGAFVAAVSKGQNSSTTNVTARGRSRSVYTKMVEQQDIQYVLSKYYKPDSSDDL